MRVLLLGRGKTGSAVAEVARERGHSVRILTEIENVNGSALTHTFLGGFDVVIDFTTPQAAVANMKACLSAGAKMVVGTTGWYDRLPEIRAIVERRGGALLYGSNFSIGMQIFMRLAEQFATAFQTRQEYKLHITETHHESKLDAPSGTAMSLQQLLAASGHQVEITYHRTGDALGTHEIEARSAQDSVLLRHESFSRKGFAEGAVRGAEWIVNQQGMFDYHDIFPKL